MPRLPWKKKKKPPRNCFNETQIRHPRTGHFLRRRADARVTVRVDARVMYREGLAESHERFPRRNKRPEPNSGIAIAVGPLCLPS